MNLFKIVPVEKIVTQLFFKMLRSVERNVKKMLTFTNKCQSQVECLDTSLSMVTWDCYQKWKLASLPTSTRRMMSKYKQGHNFIQATANEVQEEQEII